MNPGTIIIGGNHQNPLGVMEALGRKGILSDVIIVCNTKRSFVLKSKYVNKGHLVNSYDEVFNILNQEYGTKENRYVVYACCDDAAAFIDRYKGRMPKNLILPGAGKGETIDNLARKDHMSQLALSIGLDVPFTLNLSKEQPLKDVEYPCITKSITSVGHGKTEFSLCHNEEDLVNFIGRLPEGETIQVQKYVEKEYEFQFLGCSLNGGEEIIIPGYTKIENALDFNNITYLEYQPVESTKRMQTLINKSMEYVKATGYTGLFSVEFLHGSDGKDYFLEMNFRNDGNGICVTTAGTNLPYIFYLWATAGDYKTEINSSEVRKVFSVPEDSYFMSMLKGDISFKKWYSNMKKANCYVTYFKGNTRPFWALMFLQKRAVAAVIAKRLLSVVRK